MGRESASGWHLDTGGLSRAVLAAAFSLSLAGCDSLAGSNPPPSADVILLQKAQERASLAQKSLNEADAMIASGQKQQADGQAMTLEGNKRVAVGMQLRSEATRQMGISTREVQDIRARLDGANVQNETLSDNPPRPAPRPSNP